jgi:ureidoacrylate peracid hydrolase
MVSSPRPNSHRTMHKSQIYPEVMKRIAERRGAEHMYDRLEPARSALVVIDMQNCWLMEGQPGYTPNCLDIVAHINRLAAALRRAGGTVIWVQMNHAPETVAQWPRFRDFFPTEAALRAWTDALTPGALGYQLWKGLQVQAEDLIVEKNRFSAFIQGSSNLDVELKSRAIDTVLITGTGTNICCESTARDAQMLNYRVVMVSDGNACRTDAEHNATLSNLFGLFADVMTTDEVLERLKAAAAAKAA